MNQGDFDQDSEQLAELLATKWAALQGRLCNKGFERSEAMELLKMYVLASSVNVELVSRDADEL